ISCYLGIRTNWDLKENDFPLLIGALGFAFTNISVSDRSSFIAARAFVGSCALVGGCLFSLGATNWRDDLCGHGVFYEDELETAPFREGFFSGLIAGPRLHRAVGEMSAPLALES